MAQKKKKGQFQQREAEQIEAYYRDLTGAHEEKERKKRPLLKVIIALVVVLCVCVGALGAMIYFNEGAPIIITANTTMQPGVTIAGVAVGGMNQDAAIAAVNDALADTYNTTMTITVLDQTLQIAPDVSGINLDVESAVHDAFACGTEDHPELDLNILPYLNLDSTAITGKIQEIAKFFPTEGTQSGWETVRKDVEGTLAEVLVLTIGTEYYDFNADALYTLIMDAYANQNFQVAYNCNQLNVSTIDLDTIYAEKCTDAVNAQLDPETHEVTQSAAGYRFDLELARELLAQAQPGEVLEFPFVDVEPEMTTEQLKSMLFRDELGTCTAYQASGSNRATNLKLACQALDGIILYPGDTFGYNATLGERTPEKGYKPAASYMGGKTIQSYGGGICQPSSALYYCTLLADLEIVQRSCHSYPSSYVPLGMDATVDWNGPDFKFRNNTDYPIRIDAKADGGSVTITLVGTDTKDYYVKMEYEVLGVSYPREIIKEVEPGSGHYDGEVETTAYTGYTVQTYKCKYDKETNELISREKEAYSVYSKRDKVVYKIKKSEEKPDEDPTEPTQPKPSDPKPTEPKPTEPQPTEPQPTEPKPTEPEPKPTEPTPTEPKPEPKPTEPQPDDGSDE